jgi:hypothetical protein
MLAFFMLTVIMLAVIMRPNGLVHALAGLRAPAAPQPDARLYGSGGNQPCWMTWVDQPSSSGISVST